ncbi:MAG: hypothetical protein ISQ70_05205 [Pirellulales bacterium]|jgi:hypothetical protein|nr:hypothetical protein [Pirellulales bacterium]
MSRSPDRLSVSRLNRQRRLVCDVVSAARRVPFFPVERLIALHELAAARAAAASRIGWAAIFVKAYAIVARDMPPLRSWYVPGFWPRQATSGESVATLSINRSIDGSDLLFWAQLPSPDRQPLMELQAAIEHRTAAPVDEVFRRQQELARLPGWLRRSVLWWNLHSTSRKRPKRMGTFSVSTLASHAAFNRFHPSPLTTSLTYGPLDDQGRSLVTILADHRLLDGVPVAKALVRLEEVLHTEIASELASVAAARVGRTAA